MTKLRALFLAGIAASLVGVVHAETLDMDRTDNASKFEHDGKPSRGMTQERVEASYGQPKSRDAAVGEPPISRWEYDNFVVFFEYDRVVHAVTKR